MQNFLTVLNLVTTFGLIVGGVLAYHHGFARTASEVQERVIHLLQSEIGAMQDRIDALEKENTRLSQVIMTIRTSLKRRGLHITIDGELVSIRDKTGLTQSARIHNAKESAGQSEAEAE